MDKNNKVKKVVKDFYAKAVSNGGCQSCCSCKNKTLNEEIAKSIGYSDQELKTVGVANLGLGVDSEEIERAQEAFRDINETRIKYVEDVLGFEAKFIEIPGTIMNQMMVITKK
jgi:hypothetical protein